MALVTVQRSPSPNTSAEADEPDGLDTSESSIKSPRQRSFSENYFTVKGAALILPQSDYEAAYSRKPTKQHGGDEIQSHLQAMFSLLRPQDTIKVAVKLEGNHTRYLAVVSCIGRQDTEESIILGIDIKEKAHIGLIIPIWADTSLKLDGDGGFHITTNNNVHCFKPVSVQAMWSALQSLNKVVKIATDKLYLPRGLTHTWMGYYEAKLLNTDPLYVAEWNTTEDIDNTYNNPVSKSKNSDEDAFYKTIKTELKKVMMSVDLEEVTCLFLRKSVEEKMGIDLKEHRSFIDREMLAILGQMDAPSLILDHLYLGSEWNASNLEELQSNGVQHILNISREIDNFFPGILHYFNVREWDVDESNLQKYWEDTYKFINKARKKGSKTLVHCKMGISRSASTVIAFLMKDNHWELKEAYDFCKSKRSIINPNTGFWKQLEEYEGILKANWNREKFNRSSQPPQVSTPEEKDEACVGVAQYFESPEEFLSMKLGPGSGDTEGFMHTEQDIEIASRSADSTEDSVPDNLSPEPVKPKKSHHKKSSRSASESGDFAGLSSDSSDYTNSESLSDPDEDDNGGDDHLFRPIDVPDINITSDDDKKKKHKKADAKRSKSESDQASVNLDNAMSLKVEDSREPAFSREGSQSRYKPDESWIKAEEENEEEDSAEKSKKDAEDTDKSKVTETEQDTKELVDEAKDKSKEESAESKLDVPEGMDVTDDVNESVSEPDAEQITTSKDLDPYTRENIPWNPGTVRKQKDDIEGKFGVVSDEKKTISQDSVTVSVRENNSEEEMPSNKIPPAQPEIKVDLADDSVESMSCDDTGENAMEVCQSKSDDEKMKDSVYAREEIDLPEGIVRKTTQEIEERNKHTKDTPKRKIQRSSSLKSLRVTPKAKDRDNERRKTCIALLSPTQQQEPDSPGFDLHTDKDSNTIKTESVEMTDHSRTEALSAQASGDNDDESVSSATVKVYKYFGEELTVQEGLVRKQKMDIEQNARKQYSKPVDDQISVEQCSTSVPVLNEPSVNIKQASPSLSSSPTLVQYVESGMHDSDKYNEEGLRDNDSPRGSVDCAHIQKVDVIKANLVDRSGENQLDRGISSGAQLVGQKQKQESRFDRETLELIREIGSALLNSPAKTQTEQENESPPQGKGLVSHFVKQIEDASGIHKKKARKAIIVIDRDVESTTDQTDKPLQHSPVLYGLPRTCSTDTADRSKSHPQVDPVHKGTAKPLNDDCGNLSSPVETSSGSPKWSPVAKTIEDKESEPSKTDDTGRPELSDLTLEFPSHTAEIFTNSGHTSSQEDSTSESCSVRNLRDKFEHSETSSGKSTPVFGISNLSSPSTATHFFPGAKTETETTEVEKISQTVGGLEAAAQAKPNTSSQQHRRSEPMIKLSDEDEKLYLLHKTLDEIVSKKQQNKEVLTEETKSVDTVISEEEESDTNVVRPKSAGQRLGRGRRSDSRCFNRGKSHTLPYSETEEQQRDRKQFGRSHPLEKLQGQSYMHNRRSNPFYNTM